MHTFSFVIVNVCLYCNGLEMLSPDSCFHMFLQLTTFHIAFVGLVIVRCFFVTDERRKWETFQDHPVSLYDMA